jgi:IclR family acetate operon transcriptional repressor
MENTEEKKYIQSVERALRMLNYVADKGSVRLGAISEYAGLKTSTAFGLLQTLEHMGYLTRRENDMEYCLGLSSLKLGLCFGQNSGLAERIHDLLTEMVRQIDETAYFEVKVGKRYYYYDFVVSTQPLKVVPNSDHYIDLPENSAVAKVYRGLPEGTFYATDLEEVEQGLNCFAVPFYSGGSIVGCVALTGPSCRFTAAKMGYTYEVYRNTLKRLRLADSGSGQPL